MAIQDNVKNFNFVRDKESLDDIFTIERIFRGFQENWNDYIEYTILEKEVI